MPNEVILIPQTEDMEELRRQLQLILQRMSTRIGNVMATQDVDVTNHRVINVARPINDDDAVTLGYLREQIPTQQGMTRRQKQLLNISATSTSTVFTTSSDVYQLEVLT